MIDACQARLRRPHHRRHPLLRLRPQRQEGPAARADHGAPDREHDRDGRRRPRAHHDLHAGQIQGFFNIPLDELTALYPLSALLQGARPRRLRRGGHRRGRREARPRPRRAASSRRWRSSIRAASATGRVPRRMNVIGEVEGTNVLIVDDEIDTAGTIMAAVRVLRQHGSHEVDHRRLPPDPHRPRHGAPEAGGRARNRGHRLPPNWRGQAPPEHDGHPRRPAPRRRHRPHPLWPVRGRPLPVAPTSTHARPPQEPRPSVGACGRAMPWSWPPNLYRRERLNPGM